MAYAADGTPVELRPMWTRRQTTKFNGASYITQRGAEAIYSAEGQAQCKATIDFYLENGRLMKEALAWCVQSRIEAVGRHRRSEAYSATDVRESRRTNG